MSDECRPDPRPRKPGVHGIVVDDRVYVDLHDLVDQLRQRAVRWNARAQSTGKAPEDELTPDEYRLVVVAAGIAADLEEQADELDVAGMAFVSDHNHG